MSDLSQEVSVETVALVSGQRVLFSEFEEQPGLVHAAKKLYQHSGKITCKDEELCEAIVTAYASGMVSIRLIAKRLGIGRETVKVVCRLAEEAGKLGPLKERLSGKMSRAIELGLDVLTERLEAGDVPANVLPIVIGVLVDKKALLDGEATGRIEVGPSAARAVTVEEVNGYFERLRRVAAESESVVSLGQTVPAASLAANGDGQGVPATDGGAGGCPTGGLPASARETERENLLTKEVS